MRSSLIIPTACLALIATSCSLEVTKETSPSTTTTTTTLSPATTTTTTTTTAPPPPPPAEWNQAGGITSLDCPLIGDNQTSVYIPDDWDVWCAGWLFGEQYVWENPDICEAFWNVPDSDIMQMWMEDGNDRDFAIGALDALWMTC